MLDLDGPLLDTCSIHQDLQVSDDQQKGEGGVQESIALVCEGLNVGQDISAHGKKVGATQPHAT